MSHESTCHASIKPIETQYKGYRFRSRLEARWAVFFDALGVQWEYEPEGFDLGAVGWYLPDFRISSGGVSVVWVEVKGQYPTADEHQRLATLCSAKSERGLLVWGVPSNREPESFRFAENVLVFDRDGDSYALLEVEDLFAIIPGAPDLPGRGELEAYQDAVAAARSARFGRGGRG